MCSSPLDKYQSKTTKAMIKLVSIEDYYKVMR